MRSILQQIYEEDIIPSEQFKTSQEEYEDGFKMGARIMCGAVSKEEEAVPGFTYRNGGTDDGK